MTAKPVPSFDLEFLKPVDTPDYMLPAWLGCIRFALGQPEIVQTFRDDTNQQWQPATNPLDEMIDRATGVDRAFLTAFVQWVNINMWGPIGGEPNDDC